MTATSRDVITFKMRVPEFKELSDADIAAALDEADLWLDQDMWNPVDYPWARIWLAAHTLKLMLAYASTLGPGNEVLGTVGVYARSISFGERRVMFGERKFGSSGKAGPAAPGEALLEDTIYGHNYLRLRSRNIPGIVTVESHGSPLACTGAHGR